MIVPQGDAGMTEDADVLLRRAVGGADSTALERVAAMLDQDNPAIWKAVADIPRTKHPRARGRRSARSPATHLHVISELVFAKARTGHPEALRVIARWAEADDPEAWRWLLDQAELAATAVIRHGAGRRDPELVDELAQSVVLGMHRVLKTGRFDHARAGHMRGLLRVIASRTLAKFRVSHAREARARGINASMRRPVVDAAAIAEESLSLADEVFRDLDVDQVAMNDAIARLREPQRTAVVLHARGLSLTQIAEQIGLGSKSGARRVLQSGLHEALDELDGVRRGAERNRAS